MAIYLGSSEKLNITLDGIAYNLNLFSTAPITNGVRLLTAENYIIKDSNGLYVTVQEGEE